MEDYFKYKYSNKIEFSISKSSYVSIIGNSSEIFVNSFLSYNNECSIFIEEKNISSDNFKTMYKDVGIVLYRHLNIFVAETVMDEIAFGLESLSYSRDDIHEKVTSEARKFRLNHLLIRDPNSLGSSDKAKMKILCALITNPKILIMDNILSELDYNDKLLINEILNDYKKDGGIIINVTSDIEDTLYGDRIIIIYNDSLVCDGKTLSVLNEEKLLKRLGLGLPFIIELNKYLMDYGMINKYYLTNEKLVGALWK